MRISKQYEFVYISTPKACTHTIYHILDHHYSAGLLKCGFHNNKIMDLYNKYCRWTVVRNPYTRAVDLWWSACRLAHLDQYKFRAGCGSKDNFVQFITWLADLPLKDREHEPLMLNQVEWLTPVEPITAIHLENLDEELNQLPFWFDYIKIPRLNTVTQKIKDREKEEGHPIVRPSWQEFYKDKAARDAVLKWAGNDFTRFGYSTEIKNE